MSGNVKTGVLLANGALIDPLLIRTRLQGIDIDYVVAVDGGLQYSESLELQPDVLIGDLDSVPPSDLTIVENSKITVIQSSTSKDETDLELALTNSVEAGMEKIIVIAATGGRLDMTISNLLLFKHPALQTVRMEFWTGKQTTWLISPPGETIQGERGDTLSLNPLFEDAVGITTENLAYPLFNEVLPQGPARGVSNVFTAEVVEVKLQSGQLLATHTHGRA